MTDVAPEAPVEEPVATPEVQAALDQIRSEREQEDQAAAAAAQAEQARVDTLNAAKAVCTAQCGPVSSALAAATDPRERDAIIELEKRTHAGHADQLAEAYLAFSGQRRGDSNPAPPGTTELTSDATAAGSADGEVSA